MSKYDSGVSMSSLNTTIKALDKEINAIYNRTEEGLLKAALDTIRRSIKLAPNAYGNLRQSAYCVWGKNRTPKSGGKFVDNIDSNLSSAVMASHHQSAMSAARSVTQYSAGLNKRGGIIGYSAVYALKTHENPRTGATNGKSPSGRVYPVGSFSVVGEWKFLETPIKNTSRIRSIIVSNIK